jgi:G6PDH family F420-dependent oxidoreductase
MVAAAGPKSAKLAGELGAGLITTQPDPDTVEQFRASGGAGKPCYAEITVCFHRDEKKAAEMAQEIWPIAAIPGPSITELPLPSHFEKTGKLVTKERIAEEVPCGPDPEKHLQGIRKFMDAGYDHICVHQVGPDQESFMDFYAREVLPKLR